MSVATTTTTANLGGGSPWQFGSSSTQTMSFYGATPIAQPSGAAQAAVSTSTIVAVSGTVTPSSGGAQTWGLASSTQANNLVTTVNELVTKVSSLVTLSNAERLALVNLGLIAGLNMANSKAVGVAYADPEFESVTIAGSGSMQFGANTAATVGFYGATPIAQRASGSQAAVSTSTIAAVSGTVTESSGGKQSWGMVSSTQMNNVVSTINDLVTRVSSLITLGNEERAALVALGLIKGSS